MNQPFNPYRHNVDVLRGFFRKPIVLITAIAFCLPTVYSMLEPLLSLMLTPNYIDSDKSISFSIRFDITTILFAISFFMLYFKSRSQKPFVKLNVAIMYSRVCSIVFAILNCIITALLLAAVIITTVNINQMPPEVFQTLLIIEATSFVSYIFITLMYFAIAKFTKSVKYSLTSVFITKKNSIFAFVSTVLAAVFSFVATIIPFTMLSKIADIIEFAFSLLPDDAVYGEIERFKVMYVDIMADNMPLAITKSIINILPFILFGVTALMYYFYIKKVTNELVLTPADNEATRFYSDSAPMQNNAPQMPFNQNNSAPFVPPAAPNYNPNFNQGFAQPINAPAQPDVNTYENPYKNPYESTRQAPVQPAAPPQNFVPQPVVFGNADKEDNTPNEKVCSNCGEKSPSTMKFCPHCGNKL